MNAQVLHIVPDASNRKWAGSIASELRLVEKKLQASVTSQVPQAQDIASHLLNAGGKRIRPALVLLSAFASKKNVDNDRVVGLAAATELVHMASLVHDDVVDETSERRGVATASSKWGNKLSVLGGDFLLSKAFSILATDGDMKLISVLSEMAAKMAESEMLQAASEGDLAAWEKNYWEIIKGKTANFMSACCECGAVTAGADDAARAALREYGLQIGLAFQITDDLLDISGDAAETGKETGSDLCQGKFTLPILIALRTLDEDRKSKILSVINSGTISKEDARAISESIIECGAVEEARNSAAEFAASAVRQLYMMPETIYKQSLVMLAQSIIERRA